MNVSDIMINLNNINLEELIPLLSILTQDDKVLYESIGYYVPTIYPELCEKYPRLKEMSILDKMFICKDTGFKHILAYYDADKFIFVELIFVDGDFFLPSEKCKHESMIINMVKSTEDNYINQNFSSLLLSPPDNIKMRLLKNIIDKYNEPFIYELFMDWYRFVDYGFYAFDKETILKIINQKSDEEKKLTIEKIHHFPDIVTIYRGEGNKSTSYENAYSWTTDINVANFFALRHNDGTKARIITATINKSDIIEFIDGRNEFEIIILPEHVEIVEILDLFSLDETIKYLSDVLHLIDEYKYNLKYELDFPTDCNGHDKLHTLRVLYNAACLCTLKNLSVDDTSTILNACLYHDIGRINDKEDSTHGKRSKIIFNQCEDFNEEVEFLIKYHCLDDKLGHDFIEKSPFSDKNKLTLMYNIIKDADALDRFRFGIRNLNIDFIRLEESKKLMLFARMAIDGIKI